MDKLIDCIKVNYSNFVRKKGERGCEPPPLTYVKYSMGSSLVPSHLTKSNLIRTETTMFNCPEDRCRVLEKTLYVG
jgi:hypothetical protein